MRGKLENKYMGLFKYINETRSEMKHVAWPTQRQTYIYTTLVIVVSLLVSLYLGLFDFVFTKSLQGTLDAIPGRATSETLLNSTTTPNGDLPEGLEFTTTPVDAGDSMNGTDTHTTDTPITEE